MNIDGGNNPLDISEQNYLKKLLQEKATIFILFFDLKII